MSSSGITGFNILRRNGEIVGLQCVYCKTIGGVDLFTHIPDCKVKPVYQQPVIQEKRKNIKMMQESLPK